MVSAWVTVKEAVPCEVGKVPSCVLHHPDEIDVVVIHHCTVDFDHLFR
jgi:hypothetical protein